MACKWYSCCPIKWLTDAARLDRRRVERYCLGESWRECIRYDLEERGMPHPDHVLPDGTLDESLK